jgi:hypothetical protein
MIFVVVVVAAVAYICRTCIRMNNRQYVLDTVHDCISFHLLTEFDVCHVSKH